MSNIFDDINPPEPPKSTTPAAADGWEKLSTEMDGDRVVATTKRMPVPSGGWVYRTTLHGKDGAAFVAMAFVPDVELAAEQKEMQAVTAEMIRRLGKGRQE